jgi:hypothetical protein
MVQEETELFAMAIHIFKKSNFSTLRVSRATDQLKELL